MAKSVVTHYTGLISPSEFGVRNPHSNQFDVGQNTVPARNVNKGQQAPKPCRRQTLNRIFFEKLWKVNQKVKIVHYFDNYN